MEENKTTEQATEQPATTPSLVQQPTSQVPVTDTPVVVKANAPAECGKEKRDDVVKDMAKEIAALRSELQKSNIKSALAERRLVPHDADLVSKMVVEKVDSGMSPDEACASLYQSHPYLFKNTTSPTVSENTKIEEEKARKDLNDRLVNSAISRLKRGPVTT